MHLPSVLLAALAAAPSPAPATAPILALDAGGHTAKVRAVVFTPDGRGLVTVGYDKTVRVWDLATGESVRTFRPPVGPGFPGMLYAAALSPDGRTLAVGGFGVRKEGSGQPIYLIDLPAGQIARVLYGHADTVQWLAFSPDGRRLASASFDKTARIWDAATGRSELVLQGHTEAVQALAWRPDGVALATASYDGTGRVWDSATGRATAVLTGHEGRLTAVAFSPNGERIATGGLDKTVRIWTAAGAVVGGYRWDAAVTAVAFSPVGRSLLVGRGSNGPAGCSILDGATGQERTRFTRHTNTVHCVAVSPDGALAASAGGDDDEIFVWRTADGAPLRRLTGRGHGAYAAAWSPDGQAIVWGATNHGDTVAATHPLERALRLADLSPVTLPPSAVRQQTTLGGVSLAPGGRNVVLAQRAGAAPVPLRPGDQYDVVRCFTMLPGDRAAVGAAFSLSIFDTTSGKLLRELKGHTGEVNAVALSPDGRYLLSAGADQTVRVWGPGRDEPLLSLFAAGPDWIAWTPEGYYACSPGGERLMGWHVNDGPDRLANFYPAERFHKSLFRPDVIRRLLETGSVEKALALADQGRRRPPPPTTVAQVLPPKVAITEPAAGVRLTRAEVAVRATAEGVGGHAVTSLRLQVDGRPVEVRKPDAAAGGPVSGTWTVRLGPGPHRLKVLADSAVSQGASEEVEVVSVGEQAASPELPSLYVLAVGVADYPGDLKLHYAAKDAEAVGEAFRANSQGLFRKVDVKLLTDKQATRAGVLGGLGWLRREATQRDVSVVFFSGHGQRDGDGRFYLLPVDVDADNLLATGLSDDDLKKVLADLPGRVLTLLDACHAGAAGGDARKAAGALTDDLVRDLATDDYGVVVMAAAMAREYSLENNRFGHGNFTLAVVEGLAGKAGRADGAVYLHNLDAYVTDRVKELSAGRQHPVTAKPASIRSFPLSKP